MEQNDASTRTIARTRLRDAHLPWNPIRTVRRRKIPYVIVDLSKRPGWDWLRDAWTRRVPDLRSTTHDDLSGTGRGRPVASAGQSVDIRADTGYYEYRLRRRMAASTGDKTVLHDLQYHGQYTLSSEDIPYDDFSQDCD